MEEKDAAGAGCEDCSRADGCEAYRRLIEEEGRVRERVDQRGRRWYRAYTGGGAHLANWLEQAREIGEVELEEIDSTGYACFEQGGEKIVRVWVLRPEP